MSYSIRSAFARLARRPAVEGCTWYPELLTSGLGGYQRNEMQTQQESPWDPLPRLRISLTGRDVFQTRVGPSMSFKTKPVLLGFPTPGSKPLTLAKVIRTSKEPAALNETRYRTFRDYEETMTARSVELP